MMIMMNAVRTDKARVWRGDQPGQTATESSAKGSVCLSLTMRQGSRQRDVEGQDLASLQEHSLFEPSAVPGPRRKPVAASDASASKANAISTSSDYVSAVKSSAQLKKGDSSASDLYWNLKEGGVSLSTQQANELVSLLDCSANDVRVIVWIPHILAEAAKKDACIAELGEAQLIKRFIERRQTSSDAMLQAYASALSKLSLSKESVDVLCLAVFTEQLSEASSKSLKYLIRALGGSNHSEHAVHVLGQFLEGAGALAGREAVLQSLGLCASDEARTCVSNFAAKILGNITSGTKSGMQPHSERAATLSKDLLAAISVLVSVWPAHQETSALLGRVAKESPLKAHKMAVISETLKVENLAQRANSQSWISILNSLRFDVDDEVASAAQAAIGKSQSSPAE